MSCLQCSYLYRCFSDTEEDPMGFHQYRGMINSWHGFGTSTMPSLHCTETLSCSPSPAKDTGTTTTLTSEKVYKENSYEAAQSGDIESIMPISTTSNGIVKTDAVGEKALYFSAFEEMMHDIERQQTVPQEEPHLMSQEKQGLDDEVDCVPQNTQWIEFISGAPTAQPPTTQVQ